MYRSTTLSSTSLPVMRVDQAPVTLTATLSNVSATALLSVTGWLSASTMATAHNRHTATLLPSGKVLIAGGFDGIHAYASAELYIP